MVETWKQIAFTDDLHTQGTDTALGAVGTKDPPVDADKAIYRDSTDSDALVTSTWTQVKAFLKTYFDTIYSAASHAMSTHSDEDTYDINTSGTLDAGNATVGTVTCDNITSTPNDGANHGISIVQGSELASNKYGVYAYSAVEQDNSPLVFFHQASASSGQSAFKAQHAGSGLAMEFVGNLAGQPVYIFNDGNNKNRGGIRIRAGADSGVGQTYYLYCEDGDGNVVGYIEQTAGSVLQLVDSSDRRLKENIIDSEVNGLKAVNALRVCDFDWIKGGNHCRAGLVAQEVLDVFPEAASGKPDEKEEYEVEMARGNIVTIDGTVVEEDIGIREYNQGKQHLGQFCQTKAPVMGERDKMMGVSRERIVPVLVKAIQELSAEIEMLKKR